jgi:choline dehydrogenase-like flavoprotein
VEEFMGLYGLPDHLSNLPDGNCCSRSKLTRFEQDFKTRVEGTWPGRSVVSWRYAAPNLSRVPLPIQAAKDTGLLTVKTGAIVKRITVDPCSGRATGVDFVDRAKKTEEHASANVIVLCASTIESIRLLFNSGCPRHPDGLGNSSRLLGHYFMDQCPSQIYGTIPGTSGWDFDDSAPPDPFYGPSGGIYIPRFQNLDGVTHTKFARGFAYQGAIGRSFVPEGQPTIFGIMGFGEIPPYYENRIMVNHKRRDAWGIPVAHVNCSMFDNERELLNEQVNSIREMVNACGYKVSFSGSALGLQNDTELLPDADPFTRFVFRKAFTKSLGLGAAIHECGGVRMGTDPKKSILNQYNQCWDVKNLFVTDGSCFPSSGTVGPALTIMALTARACEHIAQEYRAGTL